MNCVKCGVNKAKIKFPYSKTRIGRYNTNISITEVPVCEKCYKDLNNFKGLSMPGPYNTFCTLTTAFCIFIIAIGMFSYLGIFSVFFILCFIATLGYLVVGTVLNKSQYSPHRYIKIFNNSIYIRPEGNTDWIPLQNWDDGEIQENNVTTKEIIKCPKCSAEWIRSIPFCENCGKNLRDEN